MTQFIFVPGMFHGGWAWERIVAELERRGHSCTAPDLAGCGSDDTPPGSVTLETWTAQITELVESVEGRVVLVGHSRGGLVVSQAAERVSDQLCAIVYVCALMLPNGKSAANLPAMLEAHGVAMDASAAAIGPNAAGDAFVPGPEMIETLYAGLPAETRVRNEQLVGQEPFAPAMTPLMLTDDAYGSVPRLYVRCSRDKVLSPETQDVLIAESAPVKVVELDSGHMPIYTHVSELADILEQAAS